MWMYAEIINDTGAVVVRSEGDVSQDNDLTKLVQSALDRFRRVNPDKSFVTEIGQSGYTVRCGSADKLDA